MSYIDYKARIMGFFCLFGWFYFFYTYIPDFWSSDWQLSILKKLFSEKINDGKEHIWFLFKDSFASFSVFKMK